MTSGSRVVGEAGPGGFAKGGRGRVRSAVSALFWSPSLLLVGIIHALCQPLTKKLLIGAVILDIPLQWGTHVGMTQGMAAAKGAMDGFDLSITTLALAGLYIGWLFTERSERRLLRFVWNWPIAAYTAAVAVSLVAAANLQLSLFQVFLMAEMFLLYLYFSANLSSRDDVVFVLRLLLIGGIVESIYMLTLAMVGHELAMLRALGFKTVIYVPAGPGDTFRFGGTIGSPNYAAAYLGILIQLAFAIRQMRVPSGLRRLTIPTIILAVPALLVTLSRGGFVEVTIAMGIFTLAYWFRKGISTRHLMLLVCAFMLALAAIYVPSPVSQRLTGNDNGSASSRLPLMHLADGIIAANPILGAGANNFAAVMRRYEGPEFRHAWVYTVHNQFLLVWAETGIIGLAAFLWIFASLIRRSWRLWKGHDAMFAPLGLGVVAAICGLSSHMFVEAFSSRSLLQLVWLLFAMVDACALIQANEMDPKGLRHSRQRSMAVARQ